MWACVCMRTNKRLCVFTSKSIFRLLWLSPIYKVRIGANIPVGEMRLNLPFLPLHITFQSFYFPLTHIHLIRIYFSSAYCIHRLLLLFHSFSLRILPSLSLFTVYFSFNFLFVHSYLSLEYRPVNKSVKINCIFLCDLQLSINLLVFYFKTFCDVRSFDVSAVIMKDNLHRYQFRMDCFVLLLSSLCWKDEYFILVFFKASWNLTADCEIYLFPVLRL